MNNTVTQKQATVETKYIAIEDKMFVYQMTRFDASTNTAFLTLYKNPDDLKDGKPLKEITVGDWE
ncbi:MAG: hypothetical protein LH614_21880 [Pyrinomonadaceae bacterium]|nr:hypothetical protein [Pyrinomonadaceae bacterium]